MTRPVIINFGIVCCKNMALTMYYIYFIYIFMPFYKNTVRDHH